MKREIRLNLLLSDDESAMLRTLSEKRGLSMSDTVRSILREQAHAVERNEAAWRERFLVSDLESEFARVEAEEAPARERLRRARAAGE